MASIPRDDPFPIACPACAAADGFPYKATTIPDSSGIEVGVRCHSCQHEWATFIERVKPMSVTEAAT